MQTGYGRTKGGRMGWCVLNQFHRTHNCTNIQATNKERGKSSHTVDNDCNADADYDGADEDENEGKMCLH